MKDPGVAAVVEGPSARLRMLRVELRRCGPERGSASVESTLPKALLVQAEKVADLLRSVVRQNM